MFVELDDDDSFYTYMILCEDNSYYTGYSNDPWRRFEVHKAGRGAKYTRAHKPVKLVYVEKFKYKGAAMRRECQIKKLTHFQKEQLILSTTPKNIYR